MEGEKLKEYANIKEIEAFNLPSPHITLKEMLLLKQIIDESIQKDHIEGVVITL